MNKEIIMLFVLLGICLLALFTGKPLGHEQQINRKMEACKKAGGAFVFNEERCLQVREIPLQ
jgi:hypothetical protein